MGDKWLNANAKLGKDSMNQKLHKPFKNIQVAG